MDLIQHDFSEREFWKNIEADVAILCSDLPEMIKGQKKTELIEGLLKIKTYLLQETDIKPEELKFLDEEINRFEHTKQISLWTEQDDDLPEEIIEKYARLGAGTEGIMGIHLALNYNQLKKLTNGVYAKTGLVKFYISKEKTVYGKIVAEVYDYAQNIPIATLYTGKKSPKDGGEGGRRIALFGEKVDWKKNIKLKEIELPFHVYRFITEFNQDLILFTVSPVEIGDYIVTGMMTRCDDYRQLTESTKLPTKLPFMFAQELRNKIIQYKDHDEFMEKLNKWDFKERQWIDFPFTLELIDPETQLIKRVIPKNEVWFKRFIWAWMVHKGKGLAREYPLHIMIFGPAQSGKTTIINALHNKSKEAGAVFSGSSSTMKCLIPSFKYRPAQLGYLAESNRFAFCDEFLRCMPKLSAKGYESRIEDVGRMNDLLEHQKRLAGSGVSKVKVNMTSRVIATSNPIRQVHTASDLINSYDLSFLSRWLIYFQTLDHVKQVQNSKDSGLISTNMNLSNDDWIGVIDYLQTFSAAYDSDRLEEIKGKYSHLLSEDLLNHYNARHMHHLECLIDGITKTRCLFEQNPTFKAIPRDYEILEQIWGNIIGSWADSKKIKNLSIQDRIRHLPENCQYLYYEITKVKREVNFTDLKMMFCPEKISKKELTQNLLILIEQKAIIEDEEGNFKPYYMVERTEEEKIE